MVTVRTEDGQRLERAAFGQRHLPGQRVGGALVDDVVSARLKRLEPGESHTWDIELDKCFDFESGEYTVEMSVPVEPLGSVHHEVHINVLAAPR